MSISLKQAYAACLWVAERKLGMAVEDQLGEWDLNQIVELKDDIRRDIITSMPTDYFNDSCYFGTVPPLCENLDGDDFSGVNYIDASSFIDGHLFRYEDQSTYQDISPFRNFLYFTPNPLERFEFEPEPNQTFTIRNLPTLPIEQLSIDSCRDEDKPFLAKVAAHITLTKKLCSGEYITAGLPAALLEDEFPNVNKLTIRAEEIPHLVWESKTVPNYEDSAVELGYNRLNKAITEQSYVFIDKGEVNPILRERLEKGEQWYLNVYIKDEYELDFRNWINTEIRTLFPIPERATFKPHNNGFLVQFGSDKETIVSNSKGMSLLYKILKEYRKSSYSSGRGYSAEAIEQDIDYELGLRTKNVNDIKGYKEKRCKYFLNLLSQYFETDDWELKIKLSDNAHRTLKEINKLDDIDVMTLENLKDVLKKGPDWYIANQASLAEKFQCDDDTPEITKDIDSHRVNINNALANLRARCPHFAYYLGYSVKSKSTLGLGYSKKNQEFYFICKDNILWDFG